jgi:hypothetical protein
VNTTEVLSSLASPLSPIASAAAPGVLPTPAPAEPGRLVEGPGSIVAEGAQGETASTSASASASSGAPGRRDTASSAASGARAAGSPAQATDLLAGLGRRFRGPTLRMRFELRTSIARQIFRRDFVYVSQQLHALEASRRVQGLPREDLNEALATVGRRIDAVRTLLLHSTEQTRDLIALHGHQHSDIEFARPTVLQATIVSPYARDFMDVLVHADTALGELERAWLLGLIEPTEKGRLAGECRKAVQSVKEVVRQQRQLIGSQVRELNAHRAQETEVAAPDAEEPSEPTGADAATAGKPAEGSIDSSSALVEVLDMDEMLHTAEESRPDDEPESPGSTDAPPQPQEG